MQEKQEGMDEKHEGIDVISHFMVRKRDVLIEEQERVVDGSLLIIKTCDFIQKEIAVKKRDGSFFTAISHDCLSVNE
ncbi:MAG TPA: hypothetical protein VGC65_05700 [Bacteroidia bacterium]|jgi:hypothetical protein